MVSCNDTLSSPAQRQAEKIIGRRATPAGVGLALSAVLALGLVAGCSADTGSQAGPPPAARTADAGPSAAPGGATGSPTRSPSDNDQTGADPAPTAKPSLPPDPKAPTTVEPVARSGSHPTTRIAARPAAFDGPIRWRDGVRLQVVDIRQSTTNGVGPGSSQGAPMTTVALRLTNSSDTPLDASSVVLTTVYGTASGLVAQPVYGQPGATDFSGRIAPGSSAEASYMFAIPTKQLGAVTLYVDLDGRHAIGSFHGSAR